jgi:hypothetical protein
MFCSCLVRTSGKSIRAVKPPLGARLSELIRRPKWREPQTLGRVRLGPFRDFAMGGEPHARPRLGVANDFFKNPDA